MISSGDQNISKTFRNEHNIEISKNKPSQTDTNKKGISRKEDGAINSRLGDNNSMVERIKMWMIWRNSRKQVLAKAHWPIRKVCRAWIKEIGLKFEGEESSLEFVCSGKVLQGWEKVGDLPCNTVMVKDVKGDTDTDI